MRIDIDYVPSEKQKLFHMTDANEVLYGGAAGGGKSKAIVMDALARTLKYPGTQAYIFRRTYSELDDTIIAEAKRSYPPELCKYNSTKREMHLPNGSVIKFRHCQLPDDMYLYRGAEIQFLYFDELTSFLEAQYDFICTRLRANKRLGVTPIVRSASNPGGVGHGWVKSRFVDAGPYYKKIKRTIHSSALHKDKETVTQYIPALATDNPYITQDYIFELEQKPEALRNALLYGHWDAFEGQVFVEWKNDPEHYLDRKNTHVIDPFPIPTHWNRYMSFDFGYTKPFSCGWWAISPDGTAYRYKEWYGWNGKADTGIQLTPRQIAEGIVKMEEEERREGITIQRVADPAIFDASRGESVAMQMEPTTLRDGTRIPGVFFEKGDNARLAGLAQFHERLRFGADGKPKMQIFSTCKQFIRTIPNLPYSLKHAEDVDTAAEDHCLAGNTLVLTVDDGWMPIESLAKRGTGRVISHDGKAHTFTDCRKTQTSVDTYTIFTDNHESVTATANHRFMMSDGTWKRLDELAIGDTLYKLPNFKRNIKCVRVLKIEYAGKMDVFNMEVEDTHSFVVNGGIVAHNCFDESKYFLMMCPMATVVKHTRKGKPFTPFN